MYEIARTRISTDHTTPATPKNVDNKHLTPCRPSGLHACTHANTQSGLSDESRETVAHRGRVGKGTAMTTTTSSSQSAPFVRSHVIPSPKRIRRTRVVHISVCVCSCACVVRTRKRMPKTHSSPKRAVSIRDLPAYTYSICKHMHFNVLRVG